MQPERDHAGRVAQRYESRRGDAAIWIRHGCGDSAVWGEVNVFATYEPPWPLAPELRLLDLGAHVGYFARWALKRWPVRTLTSVEADTGNFDVLRRNSLELADPRWRTVEAAAATRAGQLRFAGGRGAASSLSEDGEEQVETIDALPLLANCELAKIDIEGGEWPILRDGRFARCGPAMLVLEYHAEGPGRRPGSEASSLLKTAGYEVTVVGPRTSDVGIVWARRRDAC